MTLRRTEENKKYIVSDIIFGGRLSWYKEVKASRARNVSTSSRLATLAIGDEKMSPLQARMGP